MSSMQRVYTPEVLDSDETAIAVVTEPTALEAITNAEIDRQIVTARRYPRSPDKFLKTAESMACKNEEVAESCFYAKPQGKDRDGRQLYVEGPSVGFANLLASTYGNMRVAARVTATKERHVTVEAYAIDLETNNGQAIEAHRSIWGKNGRYKDDMILTTQQAAISIARRNAILAIVPKPLWFPIYQKARALALGEGKSFEQRLKAALDWAHAIGVRDAEIWAVFGIEGEGDLTVQHLEYMTGFRTAIKEGEATVDSIFRPMQAAEVSNKTAALAESLKLKSVQNKPSTPAAASSPSPEKTPEPPPAAETREPEPQKSEPVRKSPYREWLDGELDQFNSAVKEVDPKAVAITVYQANNAIAKVGVDTGMMERSYVTSNGKSDPIKVTATLETFFANENTWVKETLGAYLSQKIEVMKNATK